MCVPRNPCEQVCAATGMNVSIWMGVDDFISNKTAMQEVLARMPRLDSLFFPGACESVARGGGSALYWRTQSTTS